MNLLQQITINNMKLLILLILITYSKCELFGKDSNDYMTVDVYKQTDCKGDPDKTILMLGYRTDYAPTCVTDYPLDRKHPFWYFEHNVGSGYEVHLQKNSCDGGWIHSSIKTECEYNKCCKINDQYSVMGGGSSLKINILVGLMLIMFSFM